MQKQAENSGKNTKSKSKFLILTLLILAAVSAWFSKDYLAERFKNFTPSSVKSTLKQEVGDNITNNSSSVKLDDSTIIANQDQGVQAQTSLKQPLACNIEEIVGEDVEKLEHANAVKLAHIDNYRIYLANASHLISNFLQDKTYSNQIAYARMVNLPPSISGIFELLEEYNINYLVTDAQEYKKVFPKNYKFIKKFIKIKKLTKSAKYKKKLRENIINNLELFQDYIYSNELQKMFTGQIE